MTTSIYSDINNICNRLDHEIMSLNKNVGNTPCIISSNPPDIYTKMYKVNEAFKHAAKARQLILEAKLKDLNNDNI